MTENELLNVDVFGVDPVVVSVEGEVDVASAPELRRTLDRLELDRNVIMDLSAVEFLDSSGLKVFVGQVFARRSAGGSFHVGNSSDAVRRVLEITGLDALLLEPNSV